jgi:hypothetical protein
MAACSTLSMLYPVPAPTKLNMGTKLQRAPARTAGVDEGGGGRQGLMACGRPKVLQPLAFGGVTQGVCCSLT